MDRASEPATGGGAPQPAESTANVRRIAADGQAYTLSQYVEEYGDDAHRFWDEAHDRSILRRTAFDGGGGAPQPAESTAEVRRIAEDGQAYTWPQYVETYGTDAQRCWDDAYGRSMLRRTASDGKAYTWTQCVEQFGDDAQRYWDDASQLVDEETPMLEGAAANHVQAEEPSAIRHQMRGGDDRDFRQARLNVCRAPVDDSSRWIDSDAPQLARDERPPCPTRACPVIPTVASGAETTTAQCLPTAIVPWPDAITAVPTPPPTPPTPPTPVAPVPWVDVARLASIDHIMQHYGGLCSRNHATGRWVVPATEDLLEIKDYYNWPHMLHDEALAHHEHNIISIMPTFFMDEADPNHYDRPRLDFVVSFDDGSSVRYHPSAGGDLNDAIGKRRNRLAKLRRRNGRDWR